MLGIIFSACEKNDFNSEADITSLDVANSEKQVSLNAAYAYSNLFKDKIYETTGKHYGKSVSEREAEPKREVEKCGVLHFYKRGYLDVCG